jgi:uncharacterized membrane protein
MAGLDTHGLSIPTLIAFALHIAGGSVGLVSGTVAAIAKKGGRTHRAAGNIFFWSMSLMALTALYLGFVRPGQLVNVFISIFAFYLIATGVLAAKRPPGAIGAMEKIAAVVAIVLCAPFIVLSFQLLTGMKPFFNSVVALRGPVLIAIIGFTTVLTIAALGDIKVVLARGISGAPRIARHLWRMCFGLTLAAGSAFTNGFARFLPGPYHVPLVFFLPQFLPLILLVFWIIRVRLTGWYSRPALGAS